jgi:hypothetical protein
MRTKTATHKSLADESRRLIEKAARQPGVVELLKVYKSWQQFDEVLEAHNRLMATKHIVTISSSSDPVFHQVT